MRPSHFNIDYSHPLARGLMFAGLGNAVGGKRYDDSSLMKLPGTHVNNPVLQTFIGRRVLSYTTASSQYTDCGVGWPKGSELFTWSHWVYPTTINQLSITSRTGPSGTSVGVEFLVPGNVNKLTLRCANGTTQYTGIYADCPFNQWSHAAIVRESDTILRLYINGSPVDSVEVSAGSSFAPAAQNIMIGKRDTIYFQGKVADFLIHTRALSVAEIQQLANPSNFMLSGMIKEIGQKSNVYNWEGIR